MSEKNQSLTIRVLRYLKEYPGAGIKDVASYLGISVNLARAILYRLKNRGIVEKVGNGYILTKSGEYVVEKAEASTGGGKPTGARVEQKHTPAPSPNTAASPKIHSNGASGSDAHRGLVQAGSTSSIARGEGEPQAADSSSGGYRDAEASVSFEELVRGLEEKVRKLEEELTLIKKELSKVRSLAKKRGGIGRARARYGEKEPADKLPHPVMPVLEAERILGDRLRSLTYTGRIVIVGGLAVDADYYKEFISKFPISRRDAEKLPEPDKSLLEEMKKEGKVYLHAGREYRLV